MKNICFNTHIFIWLTYLACNQFNKLFVYELILYIYIQRWYHESFILYQRIIDIQKALNNANCRLSSKKLSPWILSPSFNWLLSYSYIVYSDRCESVTITIITEYCGMIITVWHLCIYRKDISHGNRLFFLLI